MSNVYIEIAGETLNLNEKKLEGILEGRYFSNLLQSNKNYCYKNTGIIEKRYIFNIFTSKI